MTENSHVICVYRLDRDPLTCEVCGKPYESKKPPTLADVLKRSTMTCVRDSDSDFEIVWHYNEWRIYRGGGLHFQSPDESAACAEFLRLVGGGGMKNYTGSAHNITFQLNPETMAAVPSVELVLMLTEPIWEYTKGEIVKTPQIKTARIVLDPESVLSLLQTLTMAYETIQGISVSVTKSEGEEVGGEK